MRRTEAWVLFCALAAAACGGNSSGGKDSSSHWLECSDDDECSSGHCVAGRCEEADGDGGSSSFDDASTTSKSASTVPTTPAETPRTPSEAGVREPPSPPDDSGNPVEPRAPAEHVSAHCGYPSSVRDSSPSGVVSDSLEWLPRPDSSAPGGLAIEPGCGYALSEPIELRLDGADSEREIAFSYDVNGDAIDDLFVRDSSEHFGELQVFDLWVSKVDGGRLTFQHEVCGSLGAGSMGYQYFSRDLDHDSIPDLVVGLENGILALRNTPDGFEQMLSYEFASRNADASAASGWSSLLEVAVADVVDDAALDLVVGFDRNHESGLEFGVLVFAGSEGEGGFSAVPHAWSGGYSLVDDPVDTDMYWGEFAIHQASSERASLLLQLRGADGWAIETVQAAEAEGAGSQSTGFDSIEPSGDVHQLWSTTGLGSLPAIAVSSDDVEPGSVRWYLDGGQEVGAITTLFPPGTNRELGGGGAWRDNQFVLDADANTTADFVELTPVTEEEQQLAIHLGDLVFHFLVPHVLDLPRAPAMRAFPFAKVNGQSLGLLLYDGARAQDDDAPMVQHLRCSSSD